MKKFIARNINDAVKSETNFQIPRWQLSTILIAGSRLLSKEATLHTAEYVSDDNFDQSELAFKFSLLKTYVFLYFFPSIYKAVQTIVSSYEPTHKILVLITLRKLNFQTRMRNNPLVLHV